MLSIHFWATFLIILNYIREPLLDGFVNCGHIFLRSIVQIGCHVPLNFLKLSLEPPDRADLPGTAETVFSSASDSDNCFCPFSVRLKALPEALRRAGHFGHDSCLAELSQENRNRRLAKSGTLMISCHEAARSRQMSSTESTRRG